MNMVILPTWKFCELICAVAYGRLLYSTTSEDMLGVPYTPCQERGVLRRWFRPGETTNCSRSTSKDVTVPERLFRHTTARCAGRAKRVHTGTTCRARRSTAHNAGERFRLPSPVKSGYAYTENIFCRVYWTPLHTRWAEPYYKTRRCAVT